MWKVLSHDFAEGASNVVHFFTTLGGPGEKSIWSTIEFPILRHKGTMIVTHII